jgi:hypothetical protein
MAENARKCTICGKTKAESQFKIRKGKYVNQCKDCINAAARKDSKKAAAMERTRGRVARWADKPENLKKKLDKERERKKRNND